MRAPSAARVMKQAPFVPPFWNGDRMDQKTFHELYKKTPDGFKAELIGGIVYVASPTTSRHGRPHARIVYWLSVYSDHTPGTDTLDNTTNVLGAESEPQPDACLLVEPEYGGSTTDTDGYVTGPAELVAEVAYSSAAFDLHAKRIEYEQAGVREYLVAVVETQTVEWFTRGRRGFVPLKADAGGTLRSKVFPGLWLDTAAVFARSPRRLMTVLQQGLATPEHVAFVKKLEARRAALARRKPKPDA